MIEILANFHIYIGSCFLAVWTILHLIKISESPGQHSKTESDIILLTSYLPCLHIHNYFKQNLVQERLREKVLCFSIRYV